MAGGTRVALEPRIAGRLSELARNPALPVSVIRDRIEAEFGVRLGVTTVYRARGNRKPRESNLDPADQVDSFEDLAPIPDPPDHHQIEARIAQVRREKITREIKEGPLSWRNQPAFLATRTGIKEQGFTPRIWGRPMFRESAQHEMGCFHVDDC